MPSPVNQLRGVKSLTMPTVFDALVDPVTDLPGISPLSPLTSDPRKSDTHSSCFRTTGNDKEGKCPERIRFVRQKINKKIMTNRHSF